MRAIASPTGAARLLSIENDYYDYHMEVVKPDKPDSWTVAEAKARLSEVIDKARREGPQAITRHGKKAVIVVDAAEWDRTHARQREGSFAEFLMNSPLPGSGLEVTRIGGGVRDVEL